MSASTKGSVLAEAVVLGSLIGAPTYRKIALLSPGSAIDGNVQSVVISEKTVCSLERV